MRRVCTSREREAVIGEQKFLCAALCIAVIIVISLFLLGSVRTQAASAEVTHKYYTSIQIDSGDTLWSIAEDYITDDYRDMNEYIEEVCSINKICGDEIHAGAYITVPYYTDAANNR